MLAVAPPDTVLVDGMNLVFKFPDLAFCLGDRRMREAQEGLLHHLKSFFSDKMPSIQVFFDGKKNYIEDIFSESVDGMMVHYSHDKTADELIMGYLTQCPLPSSCLVISSDKEILNFARRTGAKRKSSENFYADWKKREEDLRSQELEEVKVEEPTHEELAYWEKEFLR